MKIIQVILLSIIAINFVDSMSILPPTLVYTPTPEELKLYREIEKANELKILSQKLVEIQANQTTNSTGTKIAEFLHGFFEALNMSFNQNITSPCMNDLIYILQNTSNILQNLMNDQNEQAMDALNEVSSLMPKTMKDCLFMFNITIESMENYIKDIITNPWILWENIENNQFQFVFYLQKAYFAYHDNEFELMGEDIGDAWKLIFMI